MDPQQSTPTSRRYVGFLKKKITETGSQMLTPDTSPEESEREAFQRPPAFQRARSHLPTPDPSPPMGSGSYQTDLQVSELNRHPARADANHALQDYQMQLLLLEQQNKKRLLMSQQAQLQKPLPALESRVKTADIGSGFLPTPPRSTQNSPLNQGTATSIVVQEQALQHSLAPQQHLQQMMSHQQQQLVQQQQSTPPLPRGIYPAYPQNRNQQFFGITGQNSLQQPHQLSPVQISAHQINSQSSQATQEQVISMISDPFARSIYQQQLSNPASYPLEDLDEYEPLFPEDEEKAAKNVLQLHNQPRMLPISLPLSPAPESPRAETLYSPQFNVVDIEDASGNKSLNHSTVQSVQEGATIRLSEESTTILTTRPRDQSQTHLSPDHEHRKSESHPSHPKDQLSRNNSLTSFTEDDTDWGDEEEEMASYDLQFADFSAVSERAGVDVKIALTRPVFSPIKQGIVDRLMKEFWSLWDGDGGIFRNSTIVSPVAVSIELNDNSNDNAVKSHAGGQGSSGNANSAPISNTASSAQGSTISNLKRRGREDEDDQEQNAGDDRNSKRPKKSPSPPKTPEKGTKFACPYRKRDPRKYCVRKWRPCALTPLENVARVKGHLYRHHRIFSCRRCKALFKDQAAVNSHLEQPEGCQLRAVQVADGVTADIVDKLRNKKTGQRTEVQRWEDIYRLLFPNEVVPSPYFEDIQEDLALSPDSRDLADYEEYCRRELPLLFRAALEERIQNESQPIEENIRNQLMDIIRDCQDRVSSRYRSSTATAAATPSRNPTTSLSPTMAQESRTNLSLTANATPQPSLGDISPFFQPPPPQSHLQSRLEVSDLQDSASKVLDSSEPSDSGYGSNESGIASSSFNNSRDDLSLPSSQTQFSSEPVSIGEQDTRDTDNGLLEMGLGNDFVDFTETSTFESLFDSSWYNSDLTYGTWDQDMSMENHFPSDNAV